ncbi:MAG: urease accessory protein UreE [Burkholderiaceae bacterium]
MKLFNQVLSDSAGSSSINAIALPFDQRQRSRLRITIETGPLAGQSAGIELARGTVMRSGILLATPEGDCLRVDAAAEALTQVQTDSAQTLTAIAYHLGNRHVPVQVGADWLRLQQDHVLEQMVSGLQGSVTHINAAFEPESGAYHGGGGHHHHDHNDESTSPPDRRHSPRIHDLADPASSST